MYTGRNNFSRFSFETMTSLTASSDSVGRPDSFVMDEKTYVSYFITTYQTFGTMTNPAAETTPIGLH
ncbi:MAG: hypothetical protein NTX93_01145 [Bacteroidia bacterium]|nr:hypothetical protein [Bacteroidia bacterium]